MRACFPSIILAASAACVADAATIVIGASRDNTLYQDAAGSVSNGAGAHMFSGRSGLGSVQRALFAFDLSAIPEGATIESVTLTLHMSRTQAGAELHTLHRVLADWGEGDSDASDRGGAGVTAAPGDATWLHTFSPGDHWIQPGGDFVATPSAATQVDAVASYMWSSPQMTADVQAWADSDSVNFGWMLRGDEAAASSAKRFDTSEHGIAANRPALSVVYAVPEPEAFAALLGGAGTLLGLRRLRR